jgi:hypothetical protein
MKTGVETETLTVAWKLRDKLQSYVRIQIPRNLIAPTGFCLHAHMYCRMSFQVSKGAAHGTQIGCSMYLQKITK